MKHFKIFAIIIAIIGTIAACKTSGNFKKDKAQFDEAATLAKYKSVSDLNDAYFTVKENNFFEFYMQLFDSVKNTSYPGTFTKKADTMYLNFYNKKGADILGKKALINAAKMEIVFFDNYPGIKKRLLFN